MNYYFLVLDSKNRIVFKKKLDHPSQGEALKKEFSKLDYRPHVLPGKSLNAAISSADLTVSDEKAFYIKKNLKEEFHFTDKRIKEHLGEPDRIEKVHGGTQNQFMHFYSRTRVDQFLESPAYQALLEQMQGRRAKVTQQKESRVRPGVQTPVGRGVIIKNPPRSGNSLENLAKEKLRALVKQLRKDWDLNEYRDFFQAARLMTRKHTFFVGPTNSGKSYRGFNELVAGNSGVYLAPLRLLALEGQEEVEKRGRPCSLLTGEEIDIREGAHFIASTVEMTNLDRPIDCALIDEVQMILDPNRGWAWSQAIVGIPAKRIIMTGSDECIPTLKRLIEEYLGEELEIVHLERIGKLEVIDRPVRHLSQADAGTAIIAFSRRGVLSLKKDLEDAGRRVSVLYGNLSPGVRREEAKRFRSGETDILVATDVIGMGLNLPIKTVIFSETTKFDGKEMRPLNVQEIKQIAGRAGRYGKFECGYVGVANGENLNSVARNLQKKGRSDP